MKHQLITMYICSTLLLFLNCYTQIGSSPKTEKEKFEQLSWVTLFSHIDSSHTQAELLPLATQEDFPPSDASNLALVDFINNHQPDTLTFLAVRQLASQAITETSYDTAALIYQKYHPHFPQFRDWLNETILLLTNDAADLIIKNIGSGVNTDDSQYSPVMSYDGKTLFYCSQRILNEEETENIMPQLIENIKREYRDILPYLSEDQIANLLWKELKEYTPELVYYSTWQPDTQTWGKGIPLSNDINDKSSNQAPESISADNQTLVLFGNYDCPFKRGNIYYSNKTKDGWHAPLHYPAPINSDNFEASLQLTSDGLTALFVSDRPGSVGKTRQKNTSYCNMRWGNLDIYVSTRTDSGWNDPVNLGDVINTPFCENTPYLHPDGRTLYFASNGHPGFGGLDVYYAKRLSDSSWTEWSTPVNLGKAINTIEDEWGYRINTEGTLAYFSSEKEEGFGGDDIYVVDIPQVAENVITITGTVRDQEGIPLNAN